MAADGRAVLVYWFTIRYSSAPTVHTPVYNLPQAVSVSQRNSSDHLTLSRPRVRDHRGRLEGRPQRGGPEMRAAPASEGQSCERRDPVHQELAEGQLSQAVDADQGEEGAG